MDTFERKLEESQRRLGIDPRDFIPVQYVTETSRSKGLMSAFMGYDGLFALFVFTLLCCFGSSVDLFLIYATTIESACFSVTLVLAHGSGFLLRIG